ncbi:HK97-gp10 family putative phage morphogenesis protein [Anaerobacillus isosaccharinicus]|uniref:HK97-gp10 family putative phage morphogenesis protein n=1 Tax=Anaerobacillus isosaccharinicus TaxID=1532552 RepID=A0A7S7L9Y6_9BACI|nr:HK97-gp10 family putative phage morphogenesis protein [Anaerobacillus isosaccharinicus]
MKIDGLDSILQKLSILNVDEALENKALNKAGKLTQEAIIDEAPVDQGVLKKNIKLSRPKNGEAVIHTGGAYHAHLIELGRSGGSTTTKKGKKVSWGSTAPNPFFSRGFEQSKNTAKQAMIDELKKGLKL